MRVLDLFAGIGGFSLAAHWAGWETAAFVEWDKFCQKVLTKNFLDVPIYGDIKDFHYEQEKERIGPVDLICGGFPCQPFSHAGKRNGTADDRYLWPEMLRVIREVKPSWVVGENVAGLLSMDGGAVFESVCTSLEDEGYTVEAFVIPAIAVGAPHRRDRIWIVAHAGSSNARGIAGGLQSQNDREGVQQGQRMDQPCGADSVHGFTADAGSKSIVQGDNGREEYESDNGAEVRNIIAASGGAVITDPDSGGRDERQGRAKWKALYGREGDRGDQWREHWYEAATRICGIHDGVSRGLDRSKRLKALGNAIVPQVAYEIFRAINETKA